MKYPDLDGAMTVNLKEILLLNPVGVVSLWDVLIPALKRRIIHIEALSGSDILSITFIIHYSLIGVGYFSAAFIAYS